VSGEPGGSEESGSQVVEESVESGSRGYRVSRGCRLDG